MSIYSPYKIFHHQDRIKQIKEGKQIIPVQIQFVISDLCNQDCYFCAYRQSSYPSSQLFKIEKNGKTIKNPNRFIEKDKCFEILEDAAEMGVKAIQFTGGGEPTVHKHHIEIFEKALSLGLECALVSNGMNISNECAELLSRFKWVRISLDSGTSKSYSKIRKTNESNFDKVLLNINNIMSSIDYAKSNTIVGLGFVVTTDNFLEINDFFETAKKLNVHNVRISAEFQVKDDEYFIHIHSVVKSILNEYKEKFSKYFDIFDNFGDRFSDLKQKNPDYSFCGYQQFVTYIGGDLNVYRCCVTSYNEFGLIGSLKEQTFKQLWESEEKKQKIDSFIAKNCERCMFNNKNRIINYALEKEPGHVNFV